MITIMIIINITIKKGRTRPKETLFQEQEDKEVLLGRSLKLEWRSTGWRR